MSSCLEYPDLVQNRSLMLKMVPVVSVSEKMMAASMATLYKSFMASMVR